MNYFFLITAIFDKLLESLGCRHILLPLLLAAENEYIYRYIHTCQTKETTLATRKRFFTESQHK